MGRVLKDGILTSMQGLCQGIGSNSKRIRGLSEISLSADSLDEVFRWLQEQTPATAVRVKYYGDWRRELHPMAKRLL